LLNRRLRKIPRQFNEKESVGFRAAGKGLTRPDRREPHHKKEADMARADGKPLKPDAGQKADAGASQLEPDVPDCLRGGDIPNLDFRKNDLPGHEQTRLGLITELRS
jgi:hypothetical protein